MAMSWEGVFCGGFTIYDFYEVIDSFETANIETEEEDKECAEEKTPQLHIEIPTPVSNFSKSPKRRTFGAQFAELKEELEELKLEIEIKNTQIFAMLHELNKLLKK